MAVDLCHGTGIDWSMSGKEHHLTAIVFAASVTRMKRSEGCLVGLSQNRGNGVQSNDCWIAVCEMGTVALEVAPKVALEVELEVANVVSMSRNEEGIGRTKSTLSLVFLCLYGPCFRPDALVSMLIVPTDENPPLIFCP